MAEAVGAVCSTLIDHLSKRPEGQVVSVGELSGGFGP
jgi:hypothetical protein